MKKASPTSNLTGHCNGAASLNEQSITLQQSTNCCFTQLQEGCKENS